MKKLTILLICLFLIVGCSTNNETEMDSSNSNVDIENTSTSSSDNETSEEEYGEYTVQLYLFHSNSCSHCQEEVAWLQSIEDEYPYLEIHYYEVSENTEIYTKVKEALGVSSNSVPFTIIGNEYFIGFSSTKERKFIRTIKEMSQKNLCDVVDTAINGGDVSSCIAQNEGI